MNEGSMPNIPSPRDFFLEVAPYSSFEIGPQEFVAVMAVQFYQATLDTYCVECGKDAVFQSLAPPLRLPGPGKEPCEVSLQRLLESPYQQAVWPWETTMPLIVHPPMTLSQMEPIALQNRVFQVEFACSRDKTHLLYFFGSWAKVGGEGPVFWGFVHHNHQDRPMSHFFFRIQNGSITKVGQSPALAELHLSEVGKYRKLLGDEKHREFTRAIGLNAHGVGIGAFVYLRRIVENLIENARAEAAKTERWDEELYKSSRMAEKIGLLQGHLPSFLIENRGLYSILSLGIHDLDEKDCLDAFPLLRTGIELTLDEKLAERERARKTAATTRAIAERVAAVKKS
jgi:hypothetical protein